MLSLDTVDEHKRFPGPCVAGSNPARPAYLEGLFRFFGFCRWRFEFFRWHGGCAEVRGIGLESLDHGFVLRLPLAAIVCVGQVAVRADEYVHPPVSVTLVEDGILLNT